MDRLFRIPPIKRKAQDGSNDQVTVEHRIGRDAGAFTREHLMEKLGFETEYKDYCKELNKRIHNNDNLKEMMADRYKTLKGKINHVVTSYRHFLETFYRNYTARPLLPLFAFVPISDKSDGIFIQGLLDATTYKLIIGDPKDDVAWCEKTFSQTFKQKQLNERAEATAKALMLHPGLTKDLKYRVQAIANGNLPEKLTYNGSEEAK